MSTNEAFKYEVVDSSLDSTRTLSEAQIEAEEEENVEFEEGLNEEEEDEEFLDVEIEEWRTFMLASREEPSAARAMLVTARPCMRTATDSEGRTLLMKACEHGEESAVELLLESAVGGEEVQHIDAVCGEGRTALWYAVNGRHRGVARRLLQAGADSAAAGAVMPIAAAAGDALTIRKLIAAGVPLNDKDEKGRTALILASWKGHADVVRLLLAAGAAIDVQDLRGYQINDSDESDVGEDEEDEQLKNNPGTATGLRTALHYAVWEHSNDSAIVSALIAAGANVNITDCLNYTPLHFAAEYNSIECVDLLLAVPGINLEVKSLNILGCSAIPGGTPLYQAVSLQHKEIVEKLLAAKADPNATDTWGDPPLFIAAGNNDTNLMRALLAAGASPSVKNNEGANLLIYLASLYDSKRLKQITIRELFTNPVLKEAMDVNATDVKGWSALMHAARTGKMTFISDLLDAGADLSIADSARNTALFYSIYGSADMNINVFLCHKPNLEHRNAKGQTLLCHLGTTLKTTTIEALVKAGANINAQDDEGMTALMWAAHYGYYRTIETLLRLGADRDLLNKEGDSALTLAGRGHRDSEKLRDLFRLL